MTSKIALAAVLATAGTAVAAKNSTDVQFSSNTQVVNLGGGIYANVSVRPTNPMAGTALSIVDITLTNAVSAGDLGNAGNTSGIVDIGALFGLAGQSVGVTGIGTNVTIATQGTSWLSEADVLFDDADGLADPDSFIFGPSGTGAEGTETIDTMGILDLTDNGLNNLTLDAGRLYFELFESFDDDAFPGFNGGPNGEDAIWNGTLSIGVNVVPAPSAIALLGLGGLVATRRRR